MSSFGTLGLAPGIEALRLERVPMQGKPTFWKHVRPKGGRDRLFCPQRGGQGILVVHRRLSSARLRMSGLHGQRRPRETRRTLEHG